MAKNKVKCALIGPGPRTSRLVCVNALTDGASAECSGQIGLNNARLAAAIAVAYAALSSGTDPDIINA